MSDKIIPYENNPNLSPLDQQFELADQAIFERRTRLLTLLEIRHWIALMEEVTKKSKNPELIVAAVKRVSDLLEQQDRLHTTTDEYEKVYDNGAEVTKAITGGTKFITAVTDISLEQPLLARNMRHETKSRRMILEDYQTHLLLQLIQLPGPSAAPFENIDQTVSMLHPRSGSESLETLPDGYGAFIKEGLFTLYTIGNSSQKPDVVKQALTRIKNIMDSERLLSNSNLYYKTRGISSIFGRKQEKHFQYLPHTTAPEYKSEQAKLQQWIQEFYLQPLQDRLNKRVRR